MGIPWESAHEIFKTATFLHHYNCLHINPWQADQKTKRKRRTDPFIKNTWALLIIAWGVYLIPVPGTSYAASILVLGALVMGITTLAKGNTHQEIIQLLSIFIVTPNFYMLGMTIFWTFRTRTIDLQDLSAKEIRNAGIESYQQEIKKYKKIIPSEKGGKEERKKEIVHVKYIVYLKAVVIWNVLMFPDR
jgi:hypothetical protein